MFRKSKRERERERERRLFKRCRNLLAGHCAAGVQAVKTVSDPTSHELWGRGAGCLNGVATYLPGTVLQGCRLLKQCRNLPAKQFVAGVQDV